MYLINSAFVKVVVDMLQDESLSVVELCKESGLNLNGINNPNAFYKRRDVCLLLSNATKQTNNENIGLKTYQYFRPGSLQLIGYVMMVSSSWKEAIEKMIYFSPLMGNGIAFEFYCSNENTYCLVFEEFPEGNMPLSRQVSDAALGLFYAFLKWIMPEYKDVVKGIDFKYAKPDNITLHNRIFNCPLNFNVDKNRIYFDAFSVTQPLNTANEMLDVLHSNLARAQVRANAGGSLILQVRGEIVNSIGRKNVDIESVAAAIFMNKRTLQRGLQKEGVYYKDILDDVRKELALQYLTQRNLSLMEVAEMLGFNEQSSFYKAYQRWFGMPPGKYRDTYLNKDNVLMPGVIGPF